MTTLRVDAIAHGGDGIGRLDGKATFVRGAVPGDVVEVEVLEDRKRFARARLVTVIEASPDRVEPPCPHFGVCGGCAWQQVSVEVQRAWKHQTVVGQLAHIGRLDDVEVRAIEGPGRPLHYRNRMDFRTKAGRPALYEVKSHEAVRLETCLLLAEPLFDLFDQIEAIDVPDQMTLRAGLRTGEVVMIADDEVVDRLVEAGFPAATEDEAVIHEIVAGEMFRISGRAFFQVNTEGAERMVDLVRQAAGATDGLHVVDAYAGGGLFAKTVAAGAGRLTVIESDPVALDDLRSNLDEDVEAIAEPVETGLELVPGSPDVVIVDPPRAGLGPDTIGHLVRIGAPVLASVSCDPASFARDARMLVDAGYRLEWVTPVDLFPQTPHTETVARFVRD